MKFSASTVQVTTPYVQGDLRTRASKRGLSPKCALTIGDLRLIRSGLSYMNRCRSFSLC